MGKNKTSSALRAEELWTRLSKDINIKLTNLQHQFVVIGIQKALDESEFKGRKKQEVLDVKFMHKYIIKRVSDILNKKEILKWVRKDLIVQEDCMETLGRLVSLIVEHIKAKIKEEFKC